MGEKLGAVLRLRTMRAKTDDQWELYFGRLKKNYKSEEQIELIGLPSAWVTIRKTFS